MYAATTLRRKREHTLPIYQEQYFQALTFTLLFSSHYHMSMGIKVKRCIYKYLYCYISRCLCVHVQVRIHINLHFYFATLFTLPKNPKPLQQKLRKNQTTGSEYFDNKQSLIIQAEEVTQIVKSITLRNMSSSTDQGQRQLQSSM